MRNMKRFMSGIMMILSGYNGLMFTALIASTTKLLPNYEYLLFGFSGWIILGVVIMVTS